MNSPATGYVLSTEAQHLIDMALDRAALRNTPISTNHLLLAIFSADNVALDYLLEQRVEPIQLVHTIDEKSAEPALVLEMVWKTAVAMSPVVTSLHLLSGLLRFHTDSRAIQTLRHAGYDTTRLRNTLISQLTHRQQTLSTEEAPWQQAEVEPEAPSVETMTPSSRQSAVHQNGHPAPAPPSNGKGYVYPQPPQAAPNPYLPPGAEAFDPRYHGLSPDHPLNAPNPYLPQMQPPPMPQMPPMMPMTGHAPMPGQRPGPARPAPRRNGASPGRAPRKPSRPRRKPTPKPRKKADKGKKNLSGRVGRRFGNCKPHRDRSALPKPSMEELAAEIFNQAEVPLDEMKRQVEDDLRRLGPDLNAHHESARAQGEVSQGANRSPGAEPPSPPAEGRQEGAPTMKIRVASGPERRSPEVQRRLEERYVLDEEVYPFLNQLGRNLSLMAVQGSIDTLVGRDSQIAQLTDILNKRRSNNPLLVGPPGVGKTAIVEGLALELTGDEVGGALNERVVIELEMGRLLSGTQLRGSFSERLIGLKDEVAKAEGRVIIFLDEIHTWIGAGASGDGGADAAGELKAALARGQFPCIGATTGEEYTKFIETDPAFRRRFQTVEVGEPTGEECLTILEGIIPSYERHHGVGFNAEALDTAIQLSQRYIPEQRLPDKAIGLLDLAGSRARRKGKAEVDRAVIAEVVSDQTGVPLDKLLMRDRERFLRMEEILGASLIGHRKVIERVSEVIRRNYAGFHSGRPIGSFLFLGPTGVGKTELVKVLADFLFRDRSAIVRLDMSEYRESHAVARLIGAPPGYIGYERGGQLTEAVRKKPYQIVLLDEVEKAHPEVLNILLQLLDDGRLTDGQGRTVDFSNTVVIMTSNLGSEYLSAGLKAVSRTRIGFGLDESLPVSQEVRLTEEVAQSVVGVARSSLSPELWNRIEERLVFGPLSRAEVSRIARLQFVDSSRRLAAERDIYMQADDSVYPYLIDHGGYDPQLGARPMRQTLQRLVEVPISELILAGRANPGDHVLVSVVDGELTFSIMDT